MRGVKDKIFSIFFLKKNTTTDFNKPARVKNIYDGEKKARKLGIQKKPEDKIIKNVINLFRLK